LPNPEVARPQDLRELLDKQIQPLEAKIHFLDKASISKHRIPVLELSLQIYNKHFRINPKELEVQLLVQEEQVDRLMPK